MGQRLTLHIKSAKKAGPIPRDSIDSAASCASVSSGSVTSRNDSGLGSVSSHTLEPRSVLIRPATVQELEDPSAPYIKRSILIQRDDMGFGFVLRGDSPCHVQTVDPLGPAAAAGLRVRQFLTHVEGQEVLRQDHRQVGRLLASRDHVSLTVLMDRRDANRCDL